MGENNIQVEDPSEKESKREFLPYQVVDFTLPLWCL